MDQLLKTFNKKYDDLYNGRAEAGDSVGYFNEVFLLKARDESTKEYKILQAFNSARRDYISSDREAAAFILALEELAEELGL